MGQVTELRLENERRADPVERMLEDTGRQKALDIRFELARRRSYSRGYWLGFASATACCIIWVVLDLLATGRLPWVGL